MSPKYLIVLGISIFFILSFFGAYYVYKQRTAQVQTALVRPSPIAIASPSGKLNNSQAPLSSRKSPSPSPSPKTNNNVAMNTNTNINTNTQPATGTGDADGIVINTPQDLEKIAGSLTIDGWTNQSGGSIEIIISDANGQIIGRTQTNACQDQNPCRVTKTVSYIATQTSTGIVEVYYLAPRDNQHQYTHSIPIYFN